MDRANSGLLAADAFRAESTTARVHEALSRSRVEQFVIS